METKRLRILFLCTANSCRSQIAEGWAKALHPGSIEAYSAGTQPSSVNPRAVEVMKEVGIALSGHRAKHLGEFIGQPFDFVVTLCGDAHEHCPFFPGAKKVVHVGFPDPAKATGSSEEMLNEFRRVRDLIRGFVERIPQSLEEAGQPVDTLPPGQRQAGRQRRRLQEREGD